MGLGRLFYIFWGAYSPPQVDRIWLWVYYNKIPIYSVFYLLKGDYRLALGACATSKIVRA